MDVYFDISYSLFYYFVLTVLTILWNYVCLVESVQNKKTKQLEEKIELLEKRLASLEGKKNVLIIDSDTLSDSDADVDVDADAESDAESETESEADAESETESEADAESDEESEADAESDEESDETKHVASTEEECIEEDEDIVKEGVVEKKSSWFFY